MLTPKPEDRITIKQIKEHPFFKQTKYDQNAAAEFLQKRKNKVDKEKWANGDKDSVNGSVNRDLPKDLPCAPCFWSSDSPNNPFFFYSQHKAEVIQDALTIFIERSTHQNGLGGVVKTRRQKDEEPELDEDGDPIMDLADNIQMASNIMSPGDWSSDDEILDNGAYNPYNVKFQVNVDEKDVYGVWRIFRESKQDLEKKYVKKKLADIEGADKKYKKDVQDIMEDYKDDDEKQKEHKKIAMEARDVSLQKQGYEDECLYLSENDREKIGIRNIVLFTPWRTPRQEKGKLPKTIKSSDGLKLKVIKNDVNRRLFPELYKMILGEVATGLMLAQDDVEEKES